MLIPSGLGRCCYLGSLFSLLFALFSGAVPLADVDRPAPIACLASFLGALERGLPTLLESQFPGHIPRAQPGPRKAEEDLREEGCRGGHRAPFRRARRATGRNGGRGKLRGNR
jgi:hypothetical protein